MANARIAQREDGGRGRQDASARDRLIRAAQELIGTVGPSVSIHLLAGRADVGVGTVYRQFGSKEGLLEEAMRDALLDFEAWMLRHFTGGIADPLERFCASMRIYTRMPLTHPVNARVLIQPEAVAMATPRNYPEAARRDLDAAIAAGRVACPDPHLRLTMVQAVTRGLLLLGVRDGAVDPAFLDDSAEECMVLLGMRRSEARRLAHRPLPDVLPD